MKAPIEERDNTGITYNPNKIINFFGEIILRAKKDLKLKDPKLVADSAMYLFPDGYGVDEADKLTFTGLCDSHLADPDHVAGRIWNDLSGDQQKRVLDILKESGLHQTCVENN